MLGLYIVVGMVLVGAIALVVLYHHDSLKMTSSTNAQVLSADEREVRDENERRDETIVTCSYTVGGREFQMQKILRGRQASRFPAGRPVPIRYNPGHPEMARFDGL